MSDLLKNIIRFVLFILVQVFVLHKIPPLHQFVVPYLYFLFILWLPYRISRFWLMTVAFLLGHFTHGFIFSKPLACMQPLACSSLTCVLFSSICLFRKKERSRAILPLLLSVWVGRSYATYVLVLTLIHNVYLVFLEWMQFGNFLYFIGKVTATTGISFILILITELLFFRKEKFRTNTV